MEIWRSAMKQRSFVVIGLGTFGSQVARALHRGGSDVLAIDVVENEVETIKNAVSKAICLDANNEEAMRAVGAYEADVAIVAIRRRFDTTVLVTHTLRREKVGEILVQVDTEKEASAIRAVGATRAIFPERDMAERIGRELLVPDLAGQIPLGPEHGIVEVACPPSFVGKSLIELDVRRRWGVNVVALRTPRAGRGGTDKFDASPAPDQPIQSGQVLLVLGATDRLAKLRDDVS